ncbi:MAG: hypothetical protein KGH62_02945, partial [Candidatus Micrarchaeota archaeon]|nr:hypothetical protein [Candidatus Micrarchaeota archaeon]
MSLLLAVLIGALSIILPGYFLALALLKKTGMPMFEIAIIGFIFGMIFPPSMIWLESYLMNYIHLFSFSANLYDVNVIVLTLIGIALSIQQGAFSTGMLSKTPFSGIKLDSISIKQNVDKDYKKRISEIRNAVAHNNLDMKMILEHERQEEDLISRHAEEMQALKGAGVEERKKIEEAHIEQERRLYEEHEAEERTFLRSGSDSESKAAEKSGKMNYVWIILLVLMVLAFATRMLSIGIAPNYFEFDPYFDMISTQYILSHGYQLLFEHAAWPSLAGGTIHRLQPIVPYLEAYWYNLAGGYSTTATTINTTLLSLVSSWYPPITAALLVFVVFMFLYHEYGEYEGLIGAGLATVMPILFTTFIAGEQLVEPWGIFALFFFYAAYVLAVHNPKEPRFAILAGIAFASNFLGAHYYTVPAGILAFYLVLQGVIHVLRNEDTKDFYKMNIIMLAVILLFFIPYNAYGATLTERTPAILGVPVIVSFPIAALAFVAVFEYLPKIAKERKIIDQPLSFSLYGIWLVIIGIIAIILILFTPLGKPIQSYLALSAKFTTPSSPLFMTVQEYAPTGLNYDFGNGGFGIIGASVGGVSITVWAVLLAFTALELLAIWKRNSKSSIMAIAAVWPLAVAGLIEVKYIPHFGVGYIIAIGAILGELAIYYASSNKDSVRKILFYAGIAVVVIEAIPTGYQVLTAAANPSCNAIGQANNQLGAVLYCNTIPGYWLQATSWMSQNVGPYGPRILSWWDYGDWINWFGNSNAVLRGDNSVPTADYAAAAHYVLTQKDGVNSSALQQYMDSVQAKYILFDDQLVPKWGALDFLACVYINQTSEQYALAQGAQYGQPYQLGTSACEIKHDPAYIFIPVSQNIGNYCQIANATTQVYLKGFVVVGSNPTNQTYCVPVAAINNGLTVHLLNNNGTKSNAIITPAFFNGETS